MIRVLIEMELNYPYNESLSSLCEFCALYRSSILFGGTYIKKTHISLPLSYFKQIFHENPQIKSYAVPSGMETIVESVKVLKIMVK